MTATKRRAVIAEEDSNVHQIKPTTEVTVTVANSFKLTLDDHKEVHYHAGVQEMPLEHAQHWYARTAGGVEIYDPKRRN